MLSSYDFFILDIWGVIHDGTSTYDGVVETIQALNKMGKQIIFLSNAPRRANKVAEVLKYFGIERQYYLDIITSGEACYREILANNQGGDIFYIGPKKDFDIFNGLKNNISDEAKNCQFAVLTGFKDDNNDIESNIPLLEDALKYNLTLYCLNPDKIVVKKNGFKWFCAGILAEKYEEMGGRVSYFGKPYPRVYDIVFDIFKQNKNLNKSNIIAIGDSIENDIRGANEFGISSCLIKNGIHKADILESSLEDLYQKYNQRPKYCLDSLKDLLDI